MNKLIVAIFASLFFGFTAFGQTASFFPLEEEVFLLGYTDKDSNGVSSPYFGTIEEAKSLNISMLFDIVEEDSAFIFRTFDLGENGKVVLLRTKTGELVERTVVFTLNDTLYGFEGSNFSRITSFGKLDDDDMILFTNLIHQLVYDLTMSKKLD